MRSDFLAQYEVRQVGRKEALKYWIPAEDLDRLNDNLLSQIELVAEYGKATDD